MSASQSRWHTVWPFAVILGALLLAVQAQAQVNPFGRYGVSLNTTDIELITDAAAGLYSRQAPVRGAQASWSNPETGNSGAVQIVRITNSPGLCVSLAHRIQIKGQQDARIFQTKRCRAPSGEWRLVFE